MNEIDNPVIRRIHAPMDDRQSQCDNYARWLKEIAEKDKMTNDERAVLYNAATIIQELEQKLLWMGEMKWHPIETAPSEGSVLITGGRHGEDVLLVPADGSWWRSYRGKSKPTHWMPLPEAPQ